MCIRDRYNVEVLGTKLSAINQAEDRELFRALMKELNEPVPDSDIVNTVQAAINFAEKIGYPVIVPVSYTHLDVYKRQILLPLTPLT